MHLIKSICIPSLLYDLEVLQLKSHEVKRLQACVNLAIINTFHTTDVDNICYISSMFNINPIEKMLHLRYANFLSSFKESFEDSYIIRNCVGSVFNCTYNSIRFS